MALIVQKFGGTSVADPAARELMLRKVEAARSKGDRIVVVVSAMGRKGAPYATDTLLGLLGEARGAAAVSVGACGSGAATAAGGRTRDLLASCGETISACLVASLLCARGTPATPMTAYTAGMRADGPFENADIASVDGERVMNAVRAGIVPVITGFQAVNPDGDIVTIGRGGSDTTAVAVGAAIGADYVDIYTDVPGVAAADPRIVPGAPFLARLDYPSMFRLASNGARVLHDRSALLGERSGARIRVRSTFDDGEGTLVSAEPLPAGAPAILGIASVAKGDGAVVTVVCAEGRAAGIRTRAVAAAEAAGATPAVTAADADADADALSFWCPAGEAPDLVRALFSAVGSL